MFIGLRVTGLRVQAPSSVTRGVQSRGLIRRRCTRSLPHLRASTCGRVQIRLWRVRFEIGYMHHGMQHHRRTSSVLSPLSPSRSLRRLLLQSPFRYRLSIISLSYNADGNNRPSLPVYLSISVVTATKFKPSPVTVSPRDNLLREYNFENRNDEICNGD